jgi:hypothetical protein
MSNTWKAEAGELEVQVQLGQHSETLSLKPNGYFKHTIKHLVL